MQAITMAVSPVPVCPVDGDSELILILQTELSWGGFCGHFLLSFFLLSVTCPQVRLF